MPHRFNRIASQVYSSGDVKASTKHIPFPSNHKSDESEASVSSLISRLEDKLDLQHTCGYITLVNFPKKREKTVKEAGGEAGEAKRESSPAVGDKMDLQLLEEELDNIDSPMAGMSSSSGNLRPNQLSLSVTTSEASKKGLEDDWKLMDVSYGIPLFNMELNCAITNKILEGDLVDQESLQSLKVTSERIKQGLLEFIKDNSITIPDWLMDNDVPFPTNPVWFDGASIKPLGRIYNR